MKLTQIICDVYTKETLIAYLLVNFLFIYNNLLCIKVKSLFLEKVYFRFTIFSVNFKCVINRKKV